MTVTILATSGGPHPASVLAQNTLRDIISIAPTATGAAREDGVKLSNLIFPILDDAHTRVQQTERAVHKMEEPLVPDHNIVNNVVHQIQVVAKGSVHELHFKQDDVINDLKRVLYHHFATNMNIERKWHADKKRGLK